MVSCAEYRLPSLKSERWFSFVMPYDKNSTHARNLTKKNVIGKAAEVGSANIVGDEVKTLGGVVDDFEYGI